MAQETEQSRSWRLFRFGLIQWPSNIFEDRFFSCAQPRLASLCAHEERTEVSKPLSPLWFTWQPKPFPEAVMGV